MLANDVILLCCFRCLPGVWVWMDGTARRSAPSSCVRRDAAPMHSTACLRGVGALAAVSHCGRRGVAGQPSQPPVSWSCACTRTIRFSVIIITAHTTTWAPPL